MDVKLNTPRTATEQAQRGSRKKRRAFTYIQELKDELKKVSWTAQEELKLSTKMVILATFLFGLGIYLVDLLIKFGLDLVGFIVRWIFG
ncbi:MAG: preprotein translocase subunit SecE [Verrucomicrobia bacterium]|nr:preprotein translocase subunit SecE [Verrucomicrobiota bacterium]